MPFGEDFFGEDREMSPPLIQSDLFNPLEYDSPVEEAGEDAGPTVVALDDKNGGGQGIPEADMDGLVEDDQLNSPAAAPSSSLKKRGRASLAAAATPAKSVTSKTPRSTKSTAAPKSADRSTGKRKAAEPEPEPEEDEMDVDEPEEEEEEEEEELEATPAAKRRGRAARSAGVAASARLAAKAAKKPAKKVGRPKKSAAADDDDVPAGEYEVESIVESAIDADTMEHMYLVKWRNYPASDNTWEPKKNLSGSLDLVRKFDTAKKKAAAARKEAAATAGDKKTGGRKPKAVKAVKAAKPAAKKAPGRPPPARRTGRPTRRTRG